MSAIVVKYQEFNSQIEKFATVSLQDFGRTKLQDLAAAYFSSLLVDRAEANPNNYIFSTAETVRLGYRNLCLSQLKVMAQLRQLEVELTQCNAQIEEGERQSQPAYEAAPKAEVSVEEIEKAQAAQGAMWLNSAQATEIKIKIEALKDIKEDINSQTQWIKKMLKTLPLDSSRRGLFDL